MKIGDFGISKRVDEQTNLHTQIGTQNYQAPEVMGLIDELETSVYTNAVDIWSLGCVIYTISAQGTVPFPTSFAVNRYCKGRMQFPEEGLTPRLSPDGIKFIKSLLFRLPSDRLTAKTALQDSWLQTGHEPFQSASRSAALSLQQSDGAMLAQATFSTSVVTNRTQDAAPLQLSANLRSFAASENLTVRARKKENWDKPRVGPTKVGSEASETSRHSSKARDAAEENWLGEDEEKEWSEEDGKEVERDSGGKSKPLTGKVRDNTRFTTTPPQGPSRTLLSSRALSIEEDEHREATELLRNAGFNYNAADYNPEAVWFWAAKDGHEVVVRLLLLNGADVEWKGEHEKTALHSAAFQGHEAVTHLLLEKGADIEGKNTAGWTALHAAAGSGHEAVTHMLLEKGADIEGKNTAGWTALHAAAGSGHEAVTHLLLEKGADIEGKNNSGWTALHLAAGSGHEAVTHLLLEKGADIEGKDNNGWTALHLAARSGHEAVTHLFLEKGADIEGKDNNGWTVLYLAAGSGHEAVTHLLLEKGADIEGKDNNGWTALHLAAYKGHEAVVCLLLEKGANIGTRDHFGRTAADWAAENGYKGCAKLLKGRRRWGIFPR